MGESFAEFRAEFNGSLRIEARSERLTSDPGVVLVRDGLERLGFIDWLCEQLHDPRRPDRITHPLQELVATSILLLGQGWRDQDDADALRDDPALRLAVSTRRGVAPLLPAPIDPVTTQVALVPDGLASQPTLSRLMRYLSSADNRRMLSHSLAELACRRIRAMRPGGHRLRYATVDLDSLPIEVHGHQPGSEHNGHYHARVYHPLLATLAETGDILGARLREGSCHTAAGALDFLLPLLDRIERELCQVASVRIDAGFPDEPFLSALETRRTAYVARVKNNAVLDRMAEPYLTRPVGRRPLEPRMWTYEMSYKAESWSRARRVVLVVLEREEELYLHHFWLITNWDAQYKPADELLDLYRERGTAEGHMGELMDVLAPALSSAPRPKDHYRHHQPARRYPSGDSFDINEVRLFLNCLAYNALHITRTLVETSTGEGWSLRRIRERILRVAARVVLHGRRAVLVIGRAAAKLWEKATAALPDLTWESE